jgi:hypothetical protein
LSLLRSRLPRRQEVFLVFAMTIAPIYLWALYNFLREVPAYLLRADLVFVLAVLSYILAAGLVESLAVTGFVVLLAMITPRRFLLDRFVPQAAILVLVPAFWAIPVHFQTRTMYDISLSPAAYTALVGVWLFTFIVALVDLSIIFRRYPRVEAGIRDFAERLTVLAWVFIALGLLSVGNILARNLIL